MGSRLQTESRSYQGARDGVDHLIFCKYLFIKNWTRARALTKETVRMTSSHQKVLIEHLTYSRNTSTMRPIAHSVQIKDRRTGPACISRDMPIYLRRHTKNVVHVPSSEQNPRRYLSSRIRLRHDLKFALWLYGTEGTMLIG